MSAGENGSEKAVRPQNKHLRPWKKGEAPRTKSPGRPRTADFAEAFRTFMQDPARTRQLFNDLRKKKTDIAMYYLAGKPLEQVRVDASITAQVIPQLDILAAAEIAKKL